MQNGRKYAGAMLASSVLLFAGSVIAEGREDYYTQTNQQRYFNMPENARDFAMAGASVPTSSDSSSVVGNPAGLGFMRDADVSVTYFHDQITGNDAADFGEIENETDGGHVLAAIPIVPTLDGTPKYGTLGLGWTGFRGDSDDVANSESRSYGLTASYGKDLSDALALGYSVGYYHKKFTQEVPADLSAKMTDGVVQTVGLQHKLSAATTWGLSSKYGFGSYDYETNGSEIASEDVSSWGASTGIAHAFGPTTLFGSVDYTNYNSDTDDDSYAWGFRTGLEQKFTDWLKGYLGYRYQANFEYDQGFENNNAKYNAVSFGAGVKLMRHLFADYGAEVRAVGDGYDWTHSVTLSVPFSMCVD